MRKTLSIIAILLVALSAKSQNYNNIVNYHINGTPVHGAKIKTNLPFANGAHMPAIKIEGYAYESIATINLAISWYVYNNEFSRMTASSSGGIAPDIWLCNENGKVVIYLDMKVYYQRFTVSAFAQGIAEKPEHFTGWTVVDEALSGTTRTLVPYSNVFKNLSLIDDLNLNVGDKGRIRIGKIGERGNINVPVGDITGSYNIDFTGYRDIQADQVGARISAFRMNRYQNNNALIQNMGLAFFTNPIGDKLGDTELVERMRIMPNGMIGVGTEKPIYPLDVNGDIRGKNLHVAGMINAREVKIEINAGADFVFAPDYNLRSLSEVEAFVKENRHLPEIPSEKQMQDEGLSINDMQIKLLQKIEELTLYVIEQDKKIKRLEEENKEIKQYMEKEVVELY